MTPALTRWERATEVPLVALAVAFLAAYAWPVLDPRLGRPWTFVCASVVWLAWVLFATDYAVRLVQAGNRRHWFLTHLLDLAVIALPLLRPLRLLRLVSLVRVINRTASSSLRGRVGLYVGVGSTLMGFVASVAVLDAERDAPGARITTFADATWWAATTMTTVGYGDLYPVTATGRWIAVGLMIAGLALLGAVSASLASWLVESVTASTVEELGEQDDRADDAVRAELAGLRRDVALLAEQLRHAGAGPVVRSRPIPCQTRPMVDPDARTVWLVRHGETEWSRNGRHTSTTDLPLLPDGERVARGLRDRLAGTDFGLVLDQPPAGGPAPPPSWPVPRRRGRRRPRRVGVRRLRGHHHRRDPPERPGLDDLVRRRPPRRDRPRRGGAARPRRRPAGRGRGHRRWSSRTATPCACWPPGGWACRPPTGATSGSTPRRCRCSATSGSPRSCCAGTADRTLPDP